MIFCHFLYLTENISFLYAILTKTFVNKKDNVLVKDAMSKFVFMNSNGKYLRALLIALGYFIATKKDDNSYLPLAAAYETFQTAILVHDDVIDNAEIRRGKKTIHKKYFEKFDKYDLKDESFEEKKSNTGNSIGICVGDIGFYISNNMIVESYMNHPNLAKVLKCYNDIVINKMTLFLNFISFIATFQRKLYHF